MRYLERDEAQREAFLALLEGIEKKRLYYLDECGVEHNLYRPCARAPRGQEVYVDTPGSRRERSSVISASQDGRLVAPMVFSGSCDHAVVEAYFGKLLLPTIPKGSVIVLDNARFHRCSSTHELVEKAGCTLLFLPVYSPDLNPIEHVWAALKQWLQTRLCKAKNKMLCIRKACLAFV